MPELYQGIRAANSRFVPQFVGSNFNELKDLGDTLDQRYRTNRDLSDKLAIELANDEVHPLDQPIIDNLKKNLYGTLDEVAKSPENFENSTGIIANEARKIFTDRGRIHSIENMKRYQAYLDEKSKLGREGEDFTKPFLGTFNPDGSLNRFQPRLEKRLDYDKQKETYFNQIEVSLNQAGYSPTEIPGLLKSIISGGISAKDIENKYLEPALTRHRTTNEYTQEFDVIKRDNPALSDKQIDKQIKDSLLATGLERVHGVHKEDLFNLSESSMKGIMGTGSMPFVPSTPGSPKTNGSATPLVSGKSKLWTGENGKTYQLYEKNGNPIDADAASNYAANHAMEGGTPSVDELFDKIEVAPYSKNSAGTVEHQHEHLSSNMTERQLNILKKERGNKPFDIENYKKEQQEALPHAMQVVEDGDQLTEDNTSIFANYLNGAGISAPTVFEGETQPKTLMEVISKMGLDPHKDKIDLVPTLLNSTSPNPQLGANLEGLLRVNGIPVKRFATMLSSQFDNASSVLNHVLQNSLYKGQDTYTPNNPYISDKEPVKIKDSKGKELTAYPTYFTTTIPTTSSKYPFDTEIHEGLSVMTDKGWKTKFTGKTLTADQFKAKYKEIAKQKLRNTYGSGQMTKQDLTKMVVP